MWRYSRGYALSDIVITGQYIVMVNSVELIGTKEYVTL